MGVPRLVTGVRRSLAVPRELDERRELLARPWAEEFLHWERDENGWHPHGYRVLPKGRSISRVTSTGWCPGLGAPGSAQTGGDA